MSGKGGHAALEALPSLTPTATAPEAMRATGTDDSPGGNLRIGTDSKCQQICQQLPAERWEVVARGE